jgi:hypothetical protein
VPYYSAIKKVIQGGIARIGTNSALCTSSSNQEIAIKRENIMDCKFGTLCLNLAIKWKYKSGIASKFSTNFWQGTESHTLKIS